MDRVQQTLDALDTIRLGDQFLRWGELVVVSQINGGRGIVKNPGIGPSIPTGPNVFLLSEDGYSTGWPLWQLRVMAAEGALTLFVPGPAVIRVRKRPGQTITRRRR